MGDIEKFEVTNILKFSIKIGHNCYLMVPKYSLFLLDINP